MVCTELGKAWLIRKSFDSYMLQHNNFVVHNPAGGVLKGSLVQWNVSVVFISGNSFLGQVELDCNEFVLHTERFVPLFVALSLPIHGAVMPTSWWLHLAVITLLFNIIGGSINISQMFISKTALLM